MIMYKYLTLALTVASLMTAGGAVSTVINLSHKVSMDLTPAIPRYPRYMLTNLFSGLTPEGVFLEENLYSTSEHLGTHVDAPSHFRQDGLKLDEIPLDRTVAYGVVIDCTREAQQRNDYKVPVQKLLEWEKVNGKIPNRAAVLFNFGWSKLYGDQNLYRGTDDIFNLTTYNFPSVTPEVIEWLLEKRDMLIFGTDALSIDAFQINDVRGTRPNHRQMAAKNRIVVENLNDLDKLPTRGFIFSAAPVQYVSASGAQVRAYALLLDEIFNYSDCRPPKPVSRPAMPIARRRRYFGSGRQEYY